MKFAKKKASELSELEPRLIQFYTERGVVAPTEGKGGGRGKARKYAIEDVIEFAIIKPLYQFGVTVQKIQEIINELRSPFIQGARGYLVSQINTKTGEKERNNYLIVYYDDDSKEIKGTHFMGRWESRKLQSMLKELKSFITINIGRIVGDIEAKTDSE